jgi:hypothetical protein
MSPGHSFMHYSGRRVEWEQVHPEFKRTFAFGLHGPDLCRQYQIHPMFPMSEEITFLRGKIQDLEEALV